MRVFCGTTVVVLVGWSLRQGPLICHFDKLSDRFSGLSDRLACAASGLPGVETVLGRGAVGLAGAEDG